MRENEQETFAAWLRREMIDRGYDVDSPRGGGRTALASDAGIAISIVSRLLSGERQPEVDTLRKLGRVFGYTITEMLVFAGLAQPDEVPRLEVIDGGGSDPEDEDSDETMLADFKAEIFRDMSERIMWNLVDLPEKARLNAIRGKRRGQRDSARRERGRADSDQPREVNGR